MLRDDPASSWLTDLKDGTWPNCIWDRRKSLPMEVRRTIEKAQTVLTQLGHKLNIAPKYGDEAATAPYEAPPVNQQDGGRKKLGKWFHVWQIIREENAVKACGKDQKIANRHNKVCAKRIDDRHLRPD